MEKEITLDDMIEWCDHYSQIHHELAAKVEKFGYTDDIHAPHAEMLDEISNQLWRLRGLEK